MAGGLTWKPAKSPTFYERTRLTFFLFGMVWRQWVGFVKLLWSSGATVSFSRTHRQRGKGVIVRNKEQTKSLRIVLSSLPEKRHVTEK